tara:strand:- start:425 stop:688 length:264 start_codon:yes stop_codon:yes gene_type:complete
MRKLNVASKVASGVAKIVWSVATIYKFGKECGNIAYNKIAYRTMWKVQLYLDGAQVSEQVLSSKALFDLMETLKHYKYPINIEIERN